MKILLSDKEENAAGLYVAGLVLGFFLGALVVMAIVLDGWLPE